MQEMIAVESRPATLRVNFEDLKQHLENELTRYDVVVTVDTVKQAKDMATELNKTKQAIDQSRKDAIAKAREPERTFDEQMRSLVTMCEDGRQRILSQVQRFEDETRDKARELLTAERARLWDELKVDDDHRRAAVEDLVKLSAVTGSGKLSKPAAGEVDKRCKEDLARQGLVERRLLELANRSYKADLKAPLTRDHVHQWLEADEETYEAELQRILDAEVKRQEEAEARLRKQWDKEQERKPAPAPATEAPNTPEAAETQEASGSRADSPAGAREPAPSPEVDDDGRIALRVTCVFETWVPAEIGNDAVEQELRRVMDKAGITTLSQVHVSRGG